MGCGQTLWNGFICGGSNNDLQHCKLVKERGGPVAWLFPSSQYSSIPSLLTRFDTCFAWYLRHIKSTCPLIAFSWHFGAAQELKGPTGLSPRVLAVADAIMAVKPDLTSDCLDSVAYRIGLLLRWVVVMC